MDELNQPATRGDLATLRTDVATLRTDVATLRTDLEAKLDQISAEANHRYDDIVERIADSQTELLKAFYGYAQGNNKRVAELEGNEGAFRSRLATLEDRILEVERRLNIPPAA